MSSHPTQGLLFGSLCVLLATRWALNFLSTEAGLCLPLWKENSHSPANSVPAGAQCYKSTFPSGFPPGQTWCLDYMWNPEQVGPHSDSLSLSWPQGPSPPIGFHKMGCLLPSSLYKCALKTKKIDGEGLCPRTPGE